MHGHVALSCSQLAHGLQNVTENVTRNREHSKNVHESERQ